MTSGPSSALDRAIHQFADPLAVLGVDGVALGLPHLLEDHLLGRLRGDPAQHVGGLGNSDFALQQRLRDCTCAPLPGRFPGRDLRPARRPSSPRRLPRAPVSLLKCDCRSSLRLVILPRGHQDGIFHGRDDDLRIDALLAAQLVNRLEQETGRHSLPRSRDSEFGIRGSRRNSARLPFGDAAFPRIPKPEFRIPVVYSSTTSFAFEMFDSSNSLTPASPRSRRTRPSSNPARRAFDNPLFSDRLAQDQARAPPGEIGEVAGLDELPIKSRRRNLQHIAPRDRVFDVQNRAQLLAHQLAVGVRNSLALIDVNPQERIRSATLQLHIDQRQTLRGHDPLGDLPDFLQVNSHARRTRLHPALVTRHHAGGAKYQPTKKWAFAHYVRSPVDSIGLHLPKCKPREHLSDTNPVLESVPTNCDLR